ncbi:MAG: hypothetical protein GX422_02675 [Deltaproteobacteria bacterium]|nr:hypothetical protein [Deltaproteobacteria bacterium]
MTDLAKRRITDMETRQRPLSLVLEILPGQAGEGLIDVYEPGSYEGMSLGKLIEETLGRTNWSIEDRQILDDIRRQMDGGRLICRGAEIQGNAQHWAVLEETESGEAYWYVAVRVIKPQEGGLCASDGVC